MLLVIDVGNTHITLGVFDKKELLGTFRMLPGRAGLLMNTEFSCAICWNTEGLQRTRLRT